MRYSSEDLSSRVFLLTWSEAAAAPEVPATGSEELELDDEAEAAAAAAAAVAWAADRVTGAAAAAEELPPAAAPSTMSVLLASAELLASMGETSAVELAAPWTLLPLPDSPFMAAAEAELLMASVTSFDRLRNSLQRRKQGNSTVQKE